MLGLIKACDERVVTQLKQKLPNYPNKSRDHIARPNSTQLASSVTTMHWALWQLNWPVQWPQCIGRCGHCTGQLSWV